MGYQSGIEDLQHIGQVITPPISTAPHLHPFRSRLRSALSLRFIHLARLPTHGPRYGLINDQHGQRVRFGLIELGG